MPKLQPTHSSLKRATSWTFYSRPYDDDGFSLSCVFSATGILHDVNQEQEHFFPVKVRFVEDLCDVRSRRCRHVEAHNGTYSNNSAGDDKRQNSFDRRRPTIVFPCSFCTVEQNTTHIQHREVTYRMLKVGTKIQRSTTTQPLLQLLVSSTRTFSMKKKKPIEATSCRYDTYIKHIGTHPNITKRMKPHVETITRYITQEWIHMYPFGARVRKLQRDLAFRMPRNERFGKVPYSQLYSILWQMENKGLISCRKACTGTLIIASPDSPDNTNEETSESIIDSLDSTNEEKSSYITGSPDSTNKEIS